MDPYHEQVQDVFRDVFDDPSLILKDEMTADDIIGWDSLGHINLIIAIERRLRVRFATAEISRLKENGANIGSLLDLIARKRRSAA
jgi:acyl carrier protein